MYNEESKNCAIVSVVSCGAFLSRPERFFAVPPSSLFLAEATVLPVALFALPIVGSVALAYALGARRVLSADLTGLLGDESLQ